MVADNLFLKHTTITLDLILSLVPEFRNQVLRKFLQDDDQSENVNSCQEEPEDMDYKVPKIQVQFHNEDISGALLDGGSGVNILPDFMYKRFQLPQLEEVPFQLKMANQRRIQPLGILRNQEIIVSRLSFQVNLVVMKMEESDSPYPLLLGRPQFKGVMKMDWGVARVTLRKGKKKISMNMVPSVVLPKQARALHAQAINMVNEVEDDEEDEF